MSKPSGNGSGGLYQVTYSVVVRAALKKLVEHAKEVGILTEVFAAIKEINGRLHTDPIVFGEPLRELKSVKGQIRIAIVSPLAVEFAVHELDRKVLVAKPLTLLSGPT